METLEIKKIVPDENQPRKYFDAIKLRSLKESIKKHGIQVPLVVEDLGAGKYLLIDGERRYRVATELHLPKVPVVIEKPTSVTERLVKQFNIQEQHESWTPLEKAVALITLADEMGLTLPQVCDLLNVPSNTAARYVAFSELVNKEAYLKSEIPLDYAAQIRWIKNALRKIRSAEGKDFDRNDEKHLESRVIAGFKSGTILHRRDLTRLKDAFTKNPKLIDEYMKDQKATPSSMFFKAKAKGAYHLRNTIVNSQYLTSNARAFLLERDVKITPEQVTTLKVAKTMIDKLLDVAE